MSEVRRNVGQGMPGVLPDLIETGIRTESFFSALRTDLSDARTASQPAAQHTFGYRERGETPAKLSSASPNFSPALISTGPYPGSFPQSPGDKTAPARTQAYRAEAVTFEPPSGVGHLPMEQQRTRGSGRRAESLGSSGARMAPLEVVSGSLGLQEIPQMQKKELQSLMSTLGVERAPRSPEVAELERSPTADHGLSISMSTIGLGRSLHVGAGRPHPHDVFDQRVDMLRRSTPEGISERRLALTPPLERRRCTLHQAGLSTMIP
jgi:hypothetical protein